MIDGDHWRVRAHLAVGSAIDWSGRLVAWMDRSAARPIGRRLTTVLWRIVFLSTVVTLPGSLFHGNWWDAGWGTVALAGSTAKLGWWTPWLAKKTET